MKFGIMSIVKERSSQLVSVGVALAHDGLRWCIYDKGLTGACFGGRIDIDGAG